MPSELPRSDEPKSSNEASAIQNGATGTRPSAPPSPDRTGSKPAIGGGAPPATIFDRFRAKALDVDRSRFASLDGTTLVAIEGNTIRIGAPAAFHVERLRQRIEDMEQLAERLFGQVVKITVEIAAAKTAREENNVNREQSRKQRQEALNSESVNLALEVLNAEIVEIRPLGEKR